MKMSSPYDFYFLNHNEKTKLFWKLLLHKYSSFSEVYFYFFLIIKNKYNPISDLSK